MTTTETALVPLGRGWYRSERYALWVGPPLCDHDPLRDALRLSLAGGSAGGTWLRLSTGTVEPGPGQDLADAIEELAEDEDNWTEVTMPPEAIDMLFITIGGILDYLAAAGE